MRRERLQAWLHYDPERQVFRLSGDPDGLQDLGEFETLADAKDCGILWLGATQQQKG